MAFLRALLTRGTSTSLVARLFVTDAGIVKVAGAGATEVLITTEMKLFSVAVYPTLA